MESTTSYARSRTLSRNDRANTTFNLFCVALCLLAALSFFYLPLPTLQWFTDYWEHASALRVLSESPFSPTNPHYATYDPDRQFIPMFVLLGGLMHITGISVETALALAAAITTVLFCVGVKVFAAEYFQHRWAPVVTMAVLLFCWGNPWIWTGFYEFRAIFHINYYPAALDLSLTFLAWGLVIKALRRASLDILTVVGLPFLSAFMFITHQLGGLFAVGGMVLFIALEPAHSTRTRLNIFLLITAGMAMTWWWPYFNPIKLTVYGAGDKENGGVPQFYYPLQVMLLIGPAWLGIPVLLEMFRKRIHLALVVGFICLSCAYVLGGMVGHPVAHRFLSYTVIYLHLPIAWKLLKLIPDRPSQLAPRSVAQRRTFAVVATLVVLAQLCLAAVDFARVAYEKQTGKSFGNFPYQNVRGELAAAIQTVPKDAILFASFDPALSVTAYKGKVVARPRAQLMIADGPARNRDNQRFFALDASQQERMALMRKYGASYILIKPDNVPGETVKHLEELGQLVPNEGPLILIKIDTSTSS